MAVNQPSKDRPVPARARGRPATLSRERVLAQALALVDEHGLEPLTMRQLGAALGVDPMAVYHYLPNKAALFDGLIERVLATVNLPTMTGAWQTDLTELAAAFRDALLAHPNALPLVSTRPVITESAFALIEAAVGILRDAGFSAQDASDGVDCIGRLVIGFALAEVGTPPGDVGAGEAEHQQAQRALPLERYPHLAALQRAGVSYNPDRLFSLAIDGMILALERRATDVRDQSWEDEAAP